MPENGKESLAVSSLQRRFRGNRVLFLGVAVLFLVGIIVYLLSLIHSKKFFLVVEGDSLVVKKGIFFLMGAEVYQPADPVQAALYTPVQLPRDKQGLREEEFDDLPSLNRDFGATLISLADELLFSGDEGKYQYGKSLLERTKNLYGLDSRQQHQIDALSADVDYLEGKRAYLEVEKVLKDALKKFKNVETGGTGRFSDAREWSLRIQQLLDAIRSTKASTQSEPLPLGGAGGLLPDRGLPPLRGVPPAPERLEQEGAREGARPANAP